MRTADKKAHDGRPAATSGTTATRSSSPPDFIPLAAAASSAVVPPAAVGRFHGAGGAVDHQPQGAGRAALGGSKVLNFQSRKFHQKQNQQQFYHQGKRKREGPAASGTATPAGPGETAFQVQAVEGRRIRQLSDDSDNNNRVLLHHQPERPGEAFRTAAASARFPVWNVAHRMYQRSIKG